MISRKAREIPPSGIRRFFELTARDKSIITLGIGEPDFDSSPKIKAKAVEAVGLNMTHYTANAGLLELRQRIAKKLRRDNAINVSEDEVLVTSGSSEGLDISLRAVLDEGDEVLLPNPAYVAYGPLTHLAGGKPVFVPTKEENDFRVKVEDMKKKLTTRTKALLYCSPNNPTGAVLTKEDLKEIAEFAIENDLLVLADEIYEKIIYEGKHHSIASFPGMVERTITLNGFSKAYASTGWRVGYLAAKGELYDAAYKIHQYCMMSAPTVSQYAMLAAFDDEESVKKMVRIFDERRKLLVKGLNEIPGISCHMPKGAFYAFPNITGTGLSSEKFAEKLIKEARVAVVPGSVFGPSGEGFARCSYSVSTETIIEALDRMGKVFSK
jgi:aminotransferase